MKKLFVLVVIMVLLTGCNRNTASASLPAQSNNGGIQAVNIPDGRVSAPDSNKPENNESPVSSLPADADIEIKEKMFIAQTNDIYLNAEDYLGKVIKYEGIFDSYTWEEENQTYYSVIRYGPGCCGNDGNAGFEVVWDGDYPEKNDWVEIIGTLEAYGENGWQYLRLNLSSLTVLSTRGAEYVTQ